MFGVSRSDRAWATTRASTLRNVTHAQPRGHRNVDKVALNVGDGRMTDDAKAGSGLK
jgi:hypothetical protein